MKTLTQILAAAAVVGAVGVAKADFTIGGGADTLGSTLGSPTSVGGTPVTQNSTFDFTISSTAPLRGFGLLTINDTGVYETGNAYADASALLALNSITVTPIGGGATALTSVNSTASLFQGHILTAGTYEAVVNWTLSGVYNSAPNYASEFQISLAATINNGPPSGLNNNVNMDAFITAVPEPSQAIAGITLLGCGGLVFLGRRFVAKKA